MSRIINGEKYNTLQDYLNDETKVDAATRAEIEFEAELIGKLIETREEKGISQRALSEMSGIKQPCIARIESMKIMPQINTLIKLLLPLGYTVEIAPIKE